MEENDYITDKFVGHNSLKAWKIEHDKNVEADKAKKEKPKSPKGNKSPKGTKSPDPKKTDGKLTAREGSAKSTGSKAAKSRSNSPGSPKSKSPGRDGSAKRVYFLKMIII